MASALSAAAASSPFSPRTIPIPMPGPVRSDDVFHTFEQTEMALFTPTDIVAMHAEETRRLKSGANVRQAEEDSHMRTFFAQIPQLTRNGFGGEVVRYNNSGVILTEDLLVGYFDQVGDADVLHIVLKWSGGLGNDAGWVLPGKRDRAYESEHPDISIFDANASLLEKEIGVNRAGIAYHEVLAYFDDRKREERFRSSGIVSFILCHTKPELIPGQRIGVPLNALKLLAERRIKLPLNPPYSEPLNIIYGMARNHDSLLLAIFKTAIFLNTIEKVRIAQGQWRRLLLTDPNAARPPLPRIEPLLECPECFELLVNAKIICQLGHTFCGNCANNPTCSICDEAVLPSAIPNRVVEEISQSRYPEEYAARFRTMRGEAPIPWDQKPGFCANLITYRA